MSFSNPVLTAMQERRSIRSFTDEAVSPEAIRAILDAGRWAPSGMHNQPFRFLVIFRGDARQEILAQHTRYSAVMRSAAASIIVCLDLEKIYNAMKDHQSAGACIQNMLIAAHSIGLGSVWIGEIVNQAESLLKAIHIPEDRYALMAVIAVGHPAESPQKNRIPLESMLLETF